MPALAPVVDKIEDVAEPARQFYVQKDGKFHIDLSGAPAGYASAADLAAANGKVVEFRDNNVKLTKEVEELRPIKVAFAGLDPEKAKSALLKVDELEKKGVKGADDIAKLVADGVSAAIKPLQDQVTSLTTREQEAVKTRDALTLRSTLSDVFGKAGGEPSALDFVVSKAPGVFKVVDGKVVAEANQFSVDKPGEPLSIHEWMTRLTKEAAFAFKPSGGGGANPAPSNGGPARPAGQTVIRNPTAQQIGQYASDLKAGKVRFEYDNNDPMTVQQ